MPIRPENRARYPKNWPQVADAIRARAGNRCQWCGARNHWYVLRGLTGQVEEQQITFFRIGKRESIRVIVTVAHLNHEPEDCRPENLAALCQSCHNRYDAKHRALNRRAKEQIDRESGGQLRFRF